MKKKPREVKARNFCEICGLKVKILGRSKEENEKNEELFRKLSALGIRDGKRYRRNVSVCVGPSPEPDFVEFCAIGSEKWINKGEGCKDFELKLDPVNLSDYISLNSSKRIARSQKRLLVGAICISVVGLLFLIFTSEIKSCLIRLFELIFN